MRIHYALPRFTALRDDHIFHQEGAPAHYSHRVRRYLDNNRPENWSGRGGLLECPDRSPDLTPCDFSCGKIKKKRYAVL